MSANSELDATVSVLYVQLFIICNQFVLNSTNFTVLGLNSKLSFTISNAAIVLSSNTLHTSGYTLPLQDKKKDSLSVSSFVVVSCCRSRTDGRSLSSRSTLFHPVERQAPVVALLSSCYPVVTNIFLNVNIVINQTYLQCVIR